MFEFYVIIKSLRSKFYDFVVVYAMMPGLFMPINKTFVVYACWTLVITTNAYGTLVVYACGTLVVHACCFVFYGIYLGYFHVPQLIPGAKITYYRTVQGLCRIYYNATLYRYTVITVSRAINTIFCFPK